MAKTRHVTPNVGWSKSSSGQAKGSSVHNAQKEATTAAKAKAAKQGAELKIHGTNGQIRESSSYGNDPHPPKADAKRATSRPATTRYTRIIMTGSGPRKLSRERVEEVVWKVVNSRTKR